VQMVIEAPEVTSTDLSSLRLVAYGGAPMTEALLRRAMAVLGCEFVGVYGSTETSGTVVFLPPQDHVPSRLRSIGKPLPWVELRIVDPMSTDDAAPGAVGEIWVRSPVVTPGYWRQPEMTAAALVEGGWLRTGDAAYADEEGFLFLHDRLKDMLITGGENVYPAEVENVLADHPDIAQVAVIGVPSERWGETVKACVVPRSGCVIDPAEVIAFCRERLAHYKCPTSVDVVDELPRNASGKILKTELRRTYGGAPAPSAR
jgi:acyl-CoA synthetase (AMP-forming)/AMP-acid ligase II